VASAYSRRRFYFTPWMAMTMAHAITEAAIGTTSGIATDFADFGFDIATHR